MVTTSSSATVRVRPSPLLRWSAFSCVFVMLLLPMGITTTASDDANLFENYYFDPWGEYPPPPQDTAAHSANEMPNQGDLSATPR